MTYVTHRRDDGEYQALLAHLMGVAERASGFGAAFSAAAHAHRTGMLHDIGKYSPAGQARQRDPEHYGKVDHATAGAQEAWRMHDPAAAFAIAGHHGGLPDCGTAASPDASHLRPRMNKALTGKMDPSAWHDEVTVGTGDLLPPWLRQERRENFHFAFMMYTRMLFSCLVDADFLDTEAFMEAGAVERGGGEGMPVLLEKLKRHVGPWLTGDAQGINAIRSGLLRQCMMGDKRPRGLYTLTIPTGGGKTVASLAFALSHAVHHGMRRVIYVVPYTSIIEQNAQVFRDILGDGNVLEHHANVELCDEERGDEENRLRLATENWDAPVVVTTAVQFFESIFAARTSRCRKLHSIADAVIIFDEAQMLPVPYLKPCVQAIVELVRHYGATAVLCTATQPALDGLIRAYAPEVTPVELCGGTAELFAAFRRTTIVREGVLTPAELAGRIVAQELVLCIVNLRRTAQEVYALLPEEGRFHLSTLMTPVHRTRVLQEIRRRLKAGLPCRVVSTSLIEAGVDVDFPAVWRERAGVDSILQAAGRCNREGRRDAADSLVHVFAFEGSAPRMIRQNVSATEAVMKAFADIASPATIEAYFRDLLILKGDAALDAKGILALCREQAFRTIAREFRLIEEETILVYIPSAENEEWLAQLRDGYVTRGLLRKLGRHAVNVRPAHLQALAGVVEQHEGYAILLDGAKYDDACGLSLDGAAQDVWIC